MKAPLIRFRIVPHSVNPLAQTIEVLDTSKEKDNLICTITQSGDGIRILSKHKSQVSKTADRALPSYLELMLQKHIQTDLLIGFSREDELL